jgi:hypothetical protein
MPSRRAGRKRPEAILVKAADMMIARRADTRARADFATWKMMAKLNGTSALPTDAQNFLASYNTLLKEMPEAKASETIIGRIYQSYYAEMGGVGTPPEVRIGPAEPVADNVTAFRRPAGGPKPVIPAGPSGKPQLPVALIFACLVVVYVGIRYFWR